MNDKGAGGSANDGIYFIFNRWRAAGRSEAAADAFMARRKVYFDALLAYSSSIGIENPTYVTALDKVVGFDIGKGTPPAGYRRDSADARHRVALHLNTKANPSRIYPNKGTPAERALEDLWRKYGGVGLNATQLSIDLTGHPGPFTTTASDGRSTTSVHYSLTREGDGGADPHWVIMGPHGAPIPYDAVPLESVVREVRQPEKRPVNSGAALAASRWGVS